MYLNNPKPFQADTILDSKFWQELSKTTVNPGIEFAFEQALLYEVPGDHSRLVVPILKTASGSFDYFSTMDRVINRIRPDVDHRVFEEDDHMHVVMVKKPS